MANLCQYLVNFSDNLKPSPDLEKRGNLLLDKFLKVICQHSKFKILRVMKAGSMGKKTAISIKIDYDCVFFIDKETDKVKFLDDLDDILTLNFNVSNKQSFNAISFFFEGYFFDFLPGIFVAENPEEQIKNVIALNDNKLKIGLTEATVIFMAEQSSTVHQLARLLKFWSHTVLVPGFFNGRSYTMELFAAMACEESPLDSDLLYCLRVALDKIRNYHKVNKFWLRFYSKEEVARHHVNLEGSQPVLLDPADPSNNLLGADRCLFFEQLAKFSQTTLDRLEAVERGVPQAVLSIFTPQPSVWDTLPNIPRKTENSMFVSHAIQANAETVPFAIQPHVQIQKGTYSINEMLVFAQCFYSMLLSSNGGLDLRENTSQAQSAISACIDTLIFGVAPTKWQPAQETFESREVVLFIPVGNLSYVKIGMDMEKNMAAPELNVPPPKASVYWNYSLE
mmetsp:Transcript_14315/g.19752  ORF Transcript_14315/g.19752 Transcript_14315/m.19752 type:complete len:451 (+) Transcript_14315:295-1647(+)|eukprot:CAMPEP_0196589972 /NCGR_PEP_ID=MMETSP1081-20130531/65140_1 /TAXON_ID=36882 /ORGANISM="Pyramimonas amylifera, Strain CCMP720" /LENGTH=450 /DNA_ID=CAMNT_0041912923 /DNA_START=286 /DNA_END=1638 /DNA_ORIENTATION=-